MVNRDEAVDTVELVLVGAMRVFDFSVLFGRADPRFAMTHAKLIEVPRELLGELRAVVRLYLLHSERERLLYL